MDGPLLLADEPGVGKAALLEAVRGLGEARGLAFRHTTIAQRILDEKV